MNVEQRKAIEELKAALCIAFASLITAVTFVIDTASAALYRRGQ